MRAAGVVRAVGDRPGAHVGRSPRRWPGGLCDVESPLGVAGPQQLRVELAELGQPGGAGTGDDGDLVASSGQLVRERAADAVGADDRDGQRSDRGGCPGCSCEEVTFIEVLDQTDALRLPAELKDVLHIPFAGPPRTARCIKHRSRPKLSPSHAYKRNTPGGGNWVHDGDLDEVIPEDPGAGSSPRPLALQDGCSAQRPVPASLRQQRPWPATGSLA